MENSIAEVTQQPAMDSHPAPEASSSAPVQEKMVPQSKVDEIIRHSNARVAQKAREQAREEYKREAESQTRDLTGSFSDSLPPSSTFSRAPSSEDEAKRVQAIVTDTLANMHKAALEKQQYEKGTQIAEQFIEKMKNAPDDYADYSEVVSAIPFVNIPDIVRVSNELDNTSEIMYELGKNPSKLANLKQIADFGGEALLKREIQKLSDSIKTNRQAQQMPTANAPMSQIKPSPVGKSDNGGSLSVSDWRKIMKGNRRFR